MMISRDDLTLEEGEALPYTHEVVLTVRSNKDDEGCFFKVEWNPSLTGEDYEQLGYQPTAHHFAELYLLPMLERAYMQSLHPGMLEEPEGKPN